MSGKRHTPPAKNGGAQGIDFDAWARAGRTPSRLCGTCHDYPVARVLISRFIEMKARRETAKSYMELHRAILRPAGYPLTYGAMLKHIAGCEAEAYAKAKATAGTA